MLHKRILLSCLLAISTFGLAQGASAIGIASIVVDGPADGYSVNMTFSNDALSTEDILSITLDGSTSETAPIIWDSAGTVVSPPGASVLIVGEDSTLLTVTFGDSPDGFNPGEFFALNGMDPDFAIIPSVEIASLIGVTVTFTFSGGPSLQGTLALEDPGDLSQGLTLVPEPSTALLLLLGLVGLERFGRRR